MTAMRTTPYLLFRSSEILLSFLYIKYLSRKSADDGISCLSQFLAVSYLVLREQTLIPHCICLLFLSIE